MITNPNEYWSLLYQIQDKNNPSSTVGQISPIPIPSDEEILKVDLNTRTVEAPEFLSVRTDHSAEVLFFEVDRYHDSMDLAMTCCVIQYINAEGSSRIYPVPFYDTVTKREENKMLIPWLINGEVTKKEGMVEYSLRFYAVNVDNQTFSYSLNTIPVTSKVLYGLNVEKQEVYDYEAEFKDCILYRLSRLEGDYNLYWLEVN